MSAAAYSPRAYRQGAVLTAPPEQLIVMLYDGARRNLHQAAAAMRARQIPLAHNKLRAAEEIIAHLRETLDHERGGEVAGRLRAIYTFCLRYLMEARCQQDPAKVEKVSALLGQLREAWAAIEVR